MLFRSGGGIKLIEVQHKPNLLLGVAVKELAHFTRVDTGDRFVVDAVLHGNGLDNPSLLTVNNAGNIFKYDMQDAQAKMYVLFSSSSPFLTHITSGGLCMRARQSLPRTRFGGSRVLRTETVLFSCPVPI